MAHVAQWKEKELANLLHLVSDNPVVGIVSVDGIAAKQMAQMRKNIGNKVHLRVAKNSLIKLALENSQGDKKEGGRAWDFRYQVQGEVDWWSVRRIQKMTYKAAGRLCRWG